MGAKVAVAVAVASACAMFGGPGFASEAPQGIHDGLTWLGQLLMREQPAPSSQRHTALSQGSGRPALQPPTGTPAARPSSPSSPGHAPGTPQQLPPPFVSSTYSPGAVPAAWSTTECAWALSTMERDLSLDQAEVAALQDGSDMRFPVSDIPVYQEWARRWSVVVAQEQGICQAPPVTVPPAADIAQTLAWFDDAVAAHKADAAVHPGYADWDNQWVSNYSRLSADYEALYRWVDPGQ